MYAGPMLFRRHLLGRFIQDGRRPILTDYLGVGHRIGLFAAGHAKASSRRAGWAGGLTKSGEGGGAAQMQIRRDR
jgi:hypothetical protein